MYEEKISSYKGHEIASMCMLTEECRQVGLVRLFVIFVNPVLMDNFIINLLANRKQCFTIFALFFLYRI